MEKNSLKKNGRGETEEEEEVKGKVQGDTKHRLQMKPWEKEEVVLHLLL